MVSATLATSGPGPKVPTLSKLPGFLIASVELLEAGGVGKAAAPKVLHTVETWGANVQPLEAYFSVEEDSEGEGEEVAEG